MVLTITASGYPLGTSTFYTWISNPPSPPFAGKHFAVKKLKNAAVNKKNSYRKLRSHYLSLASAGPFLSLRGGRRTLVFPPSGVPIQHHFPYILIANVPNLRRAVATPTKSCPQWDPKDPAIIKQKTGCTFSDTIWFTLINNWFLKLWRPSSLAPVMRHFPFPDAGLIINQLHTLLVKPTEEFKY